MRYRFFRAFELAFATLESIAAHMKEACAICPDCGRNRYRGKSCLRLPPDDVELV